MYTTMTYLMKFTQWHPNMESQAALKWLYFVTHLLKKGVLNTLFLNQEDHCCWFNMLNKSNQLHCKATSSAKRITLKH